MLSEGPVFAGVREGGSVPVNYDMRRAVCLTNDSVVRLSTSAAPTTLFTSGDQGVHIDTNSWLIVI